ncbi:MAG: hypothetical protein VR70_06780 [Rhodospirillaceae bacterium BRH_c57]|nr:MAG: hypothetical protein VR70_06780 [Rhodospirillaceae bacterium BRH_c57]
MGLRLFDDTGLARMLEDVAFGAGRPATEVLHQLGQALVARAICDGIRIMAESSPRSGALSPLMEAGRFHGSAGHGSAGLVKVLIWPESRAALAHLLAILASNALRMERAERDVVTLMRAVSTADIELQRLTHAIAHELQEPTRSVGSFAGLLRHRLNGSLHDEEREYLDFLMAGAQTIHNRLGALSRYADLATLPAQVQGVTLRAVVETALDVLQGQAAQHGAVITVDIGVDQMRGDPVLIEEALTAVILNAIIFHHSQTRPRIEIGAIGEAGTVVLWVSDDGIGMSAKARASLGHPFNRDGHDHHPDGSGMGLAIAGRCMQRMGGNIAALLLPQGGTRLELRFPGASIEVPGITPARGEPGNGENLNRG